MSDIYITYGVGEFSSEKFNEIANQPFFNKPLGGLWASAVNAPYGWADWCKNNDFGHCEKNNCFRFVLKDGANILQLNSVKDCKKLPRIVPERPDLFSIFKHHVYPDFEKMRHDGVDAISFNMSNDSTEDMFNTMYFTLYGWDCDCILVMNKDVIQITS